MIRHTCILKWSLLSCALATTAIGWLSMPSTQSAQAQEESKPANLLKNGSFEQASEEDPESPAYWEINGEVPGVNCEWVRGAAVGEPIAGEDKAFSEVKDGKYVQITKSAKKYFPIVGWEQTFDHVSEAPAITISAKVKTKNMTKAIIDAIFLDENGEWLEHKWVAYIGPKKDGGRPFTHDWKEYKGTVAIPKGCKKITVSLQDYGPGQVMFDDVVANYEMDANKITDALGAVELPNEGLSHNENSNTGTLTPALPSAPVQQVYSTTNAAGSMADTETYIGAPVVASSPLEQIPYISRLFVHKPDIILAREATMTLLQQYRAADSLDMRNKLRSELAESVSKEYELLRDERLKEIDALQKKLDETKAILEKRDAVKDKIIEKRVEQLLGVDPIYQWEGAQTVRPSTTPPALASLPEPSPATKPPGANAQLQLQLLLDELYAELKNTEDAIQRDILLSKIKIVEQKLIQIKIDGISAERE